MEARGIQLESGSLVGGYRIDELIGRGGMGVVYRATNVALNRIYALKILAPELAHDEQFRQRFRREMRIAASLHHPNVVAIHYAGDHDGLLFLVMDYISGTDLREVMIKSGPIEPNRANDLLGQLASALDAAHARGLVHRDIKPANILIAVKEGEECAYLTDFGLAKRLDSDSSLIGLTQTGVVVGTVDYMSPEQITGGRTDARTDIYALGCVFFQMLTGQAPYERENSVATLFAHVHEPPPSLQGSLDDLYPTFGAVIEKAMAKGPDDRYLSAGDFARDATAALCGSRYTGRPTVVARGEARPSLTGEDVLEPPILPSTPTKPAHDLTVAHPESEIDSSTRAAAAGARAPADPAAPAGSSGSGGPPAPGGPTVVPPAPGGPTVVPPAPGSAPSGGGRKKYRWLALAGVVVVCGAVAAVIALSSGGSKSASSGTGFSTSLQAVPTNHVTGSGSATVQVNGNLATVTVDTVGLVAGPHLMHIHGGTGSCPQAAAARSHNGHLAITPSEGNPVYGPVVTSLTNSGTTSPSVYLSSSLYPAVGGIRYTRSFQLPPSVPKLMKAGLAVIVIHGIDYDNSGHYDNVLGLAGGHPPTPLEQVSPALCGSLVTKQTASTGSDGVVYTASLHAYGDVSPSPTPSLLCHLPSEPLASPPTGAQSRAAAVT